MSEQVQASELTFETIMKWSASEMRAERKTRAAEIDEVIRKRSEDTAAKISEQTDRMNAVEQAREARKKEIQDAREKAQKDREVEMVRLSRLTPEERLAEANALTAKQEEEAKAEQAAQIAREKDEAYLKSLRPEEHAAEIARREKESSDKEASETLAAEEAAKLAAQKEIDDKAAADKTEADRLVAEEAAKAANELEAKQLEEKARIAAEEAAKPKQKIVMDFQAKDENGNPIGRRTHLEADTHEEMNEKLRTAYENAVRYAERMKKRVAASSEPPVEVKIPIALTDEQRAEIEKDLESKDEAKVTLAQIKIEKDDLNRAKRDDWLKAENTRQEVESGKFMKARPDFLPCKANAEILQNYLQNKKLSWTAENLEEAFEVNESKLALRTPAPNVPSAEETAAAEAKAKAEAEAKAKADEAARVQAEADAKAKADAEEVAKKKIEQEQAAANTATAQASVVPVTPVAGPILEEKAPAVANTAVVERKLPASGIEPGSLHGGKPSSATGSKPTGITKQDIAKMPLVEYKKRLKDPNFRRQLNALGIRA